MFRFTILKISITSLAIIILFFMSACTSTYKSDNYVRLTQISMDKLYEDISTMATSEITELLNTSEALVAPELDIEFNSLSVKAIAINGEKYLAKAYKVKDFQEKTLEVKSYIVPVKNYPDYVFFPTMTAFDSEKNQIQTMTPEENYTIRSGILKTEFIIPENAFFIIIHTDKNYLNITSVDGENGGLPHNIEYSHSDFTVKDIVFAAALSAIIGGGFYIVPVKSETILNYKNSPPENFYFGPGGVIDISIKK